MTRRFRRRMPAWLWLSAVAAAILSLRCVLSRDESTPTLAEGTATVAAVIDGRTLSVAHAEGESIEVRLLGLKVSNDAQAQSWLTENVVDQTVRIELDKRRRDRDGAQLAYVYVGHTFLNAELIRLGWAEFEAYPGDSARHAKLLREARK
jgi:endonuclease YncB( thermonuclease family)